MPREGRNPVLVAIDTPELDRAKALSQSLAGAVGGIKLGLEFFNAHGPAGVAEVAGGRGDLFLDLKYHDIPNTVAGAVRAATKLQPMILNVHAGGGPAMMRAARGGRGRGVGPARRPPPTGYSRYGAHQHG